MQLKNFKIFSSFFVGLIFATSIALPVSAGIVRLNDDVVAAVGANGLQAWNNDLGTWTTLNSVAPDVFATGDVDGNGRADVVAAFSATGGNITNTGTWIRYDDGTWQRLIALQATSIAIGNLDGDGAGKGEIVFAFPSFAGKRLCYLLNDSQNGVSPADTSNYLSLFGAEAPTVLALGDIDGDGNLDVLHVLPSWGTWSIKNISVSNTWKKIHPWLATKLDAGDLNGAAGRKEEVLIDFGITKSPTLAFWQYNLEGPSPAWSKIHGKTTSAFSVGDVNGNGKSDIAVSWIDFGASYLYLDGGSWEWLVGKGGPSISVGQVDGDAGGKADVAIAVSVSAGFLKSPGACGTSGVCLVPNNTFGRWRIQLDTGTPLVASQLNAGAGVVTVP